MRLALPFEKRVREYIDYCKSNEIDFVQGETVVTTRESYDVVRRIDIPRGTVGIVEADKVENLFGIPANCWVVFVQTEKFGKIILEQEHIESGFFKSVDPVWSKPPKKPYSIGRG